MRRWLKLHIVGTLLLISQVAQAFILLTASMDDVKRIAKKFVSESLADKITDMLVKVSEQMNTNLSQENEQNEDEFENISNELLTNYKPSKSAGRQRFETKLKRVEDDEFVLATATDTTINDRSNTFMEWDSETMNQVAKEEAMHNVDFDISKPAYHEEDKLIDKEFDNDMKTRGVRGNVRMDEDKQDNKLGQDNTDHELENVRFDHDHEINEYHHESEKPTNDFDLKLNEQSKEESKELAPPDSGSERDIRQKKKIEPNRDIAPKKDMDPKKDTELRKPIEKQYESQSSDEKKIQDDSDAKSSEGEMFLRHGTESTTSEKSRYIENMYQIHTTKNTQASSDKPKDKNSMVKSKPKDKNSMVKSKTKNNNSMVKRPHHRLAESKEITEDILQGNAVPFLKNIDERKYENSKKSERRGNVYMKHLLATSGPIALPKISNKRVVKDSSPVESESWI